MFGDKLTAFLAVLTWASIRPTKGSSKAMTESEYNKVCDVAEMLQKIPGEAKRRLANIGAKQTARTKAELQLRILAAQTDDPSSSMGYTAIAEIVAGYAQQQNDAMDTQVQQAITAAAQAGVAAGRIDELFTLLSEHDTGGTTTSFCLASDDGNAAKAHTGYTGKCKITNTEFAQTTVDVTTVITDAGFKQIKAKDIGAGGTGATTCALTTTTSSDNPTNSFGHNARDFDVAGGLLKASVGTAASGTWKLGAGNSIATNWQAKAGTEKIKTAYKAAAATKDLHDSSAEPTEAADYVKRAAQDDKAKQTLKLILKVQRNITDPSTAENEAESILEGVAGPKGKRGEKLATDILAAKAIKITTDGATPTDLKLITAVSELETTLTFYLAAQKAKLQNQVEAIASLRSQTNTQIQKPEEVCNAIGDNKDKCDGNENCTYDAEGEKCVLSAKGKKAAEKANQETGVKDDKTNTTGNNSFVIHKVAPLVLAVLLF
ncbi:Trypanosome variant surface glycoprotein (A-type)/Trypanosome variant surface glycoprotein C-terminal domain containing protein, putative [Trypanosoma equiperdum]|uniref:Trypanosome variant surface glycoprotein (A-type)/Trypanosome variant surface glycoprotein C-terminal domain containing protein, putative n=1 Tax=Trypanosoma equiperdum TaxID=5694 RepID=A0A1G4I8F8_TRYEQ|nr:Trypanosome variant surface glycoprotein (A-type)/Trypanosome variant surface glycoprotein C-terminal domain containing protein, putative [Trypanosoma equiperdum]